MSVDLYYDYYHKKCIDPDIIPYLDINPSIEDDWHENWYPGRMKDCPEFYNYCREYCTIHDEKNNCYIFEDTIKLFNFAALIPDSIATYITENYAEDIVFIIWVR